MNQIEEFQPFNEGIRKVWDTETGEWWYAVVDMIEMLTETASPSRYWNELRHSVREKSGIELFDFTEKFSMKSKKNNRQYKIDCSNQEGMLRIVQSIPSSKAEPFKQWLSMPPYFAFQL